MSNHSIFGPLPDGHIRLLYTQVHPDRHRPWKHPQISYRLDIVPFALLRKREIDYVALSYCWNPPHLDTPAYNRRLTTNDGGRRMIKVNTVCLEVGQNLYDALLQLVEHNNSYPLWIDALCINQKDNHEKNHQVAMMGDIYRYADHVIAWIGREPKQNAAHSFELFDDQDSITPEGWAYLDKQQYFYRAWTFQEAILAKSLVVQVGGMVCDWDTFFKKCMTEWNAKEPAEKVFDAHTVRLITNISGIQNQRNQASRSLNLLSLVCDSWQREALDPRDKVYSVLAVLPEPRPFQADYRISERDVYLKVVQYCVQRRLFYFLHLAASCRKADYYALPSWIPAWHLSDPGPKCTALRIPDLKTSKLLDFHEIDDTADAEALIRNNELHVRGFVLGTILTPATAGEPTEILPVPQCIATSVSLNDTARAGAEGRPRQIDYDFSKVLNGLRLHADGRCPCFARQIFHQPVRTWMLDNGLTQKGDWLVMLFGTNGEIILRPDVESFELVADSGLDFDSPSCVASQVFQVFRQGRGTLDAQRQDGIERLSYLRGTFVLR